jgi:hypothetical protein
MANGSILQTLHHDATCHGVEQGLAYILVRSVHLNAIIFSRAPGMHCVSRGARGEASHGTWLAFRRLLILRTLDAATAWKADGMNRSIVVRDGHGCVGTSIASRFHTQANSPTR